MFSYDLSRTCDEIRPGCHHVETCRQTVPEAFTAFLEGTDFEDVIRTAVSLGGDCDTLTCIAGSMAEAMYGVPLRFGLHSVDTEDGKRWLVVFTSGEEYEKGESASTMVETVKRMLRGCRQMPENGIVFNPWGGKAFLLTKEMIGAILEANK